MMECYRRKIYFANILIILYDAPVFNRFFCYLSIFYVLRKMLSVYAGAFSMIDGAVQEEKEF